jgi:hypothetical protein
MRKTIIISTLFFLNNCSNFHNNNYYFDLHQVEKIAQSSLIEPPPAVISFTPVYVIGSNDSISETKFENLHGVYQTTYMNRYPKFSDFLFDALNQKIKLDTQNPQTHLYYSQTFLSDPGISRLYKENGLKGIIEKYCFKSNGRYTLKRGTLTLNEINSVSYYFFINQYVRVDDDYGATINFEKLPSALK